MLYKLKVNGKMASILTRDIDSLYNASRKLKQMGLDYRVFKDSKEIDDAQLYRSWVDAGNRQNIKQKITNT